MNKMIWHTERVIAHIEDAINHVRELEEIKQLKNNEELGFVFSHLQSALSEAAFLKEKCDDAR